MRDLLSVRNDVTHSQLVHRYGWLWPMIVIAIMASALRFIPASFSPYPFNNDSLLEVSLAREICATGHIAVPEYGESLSTHSESTQAWNVLLAFVASMTGRDPMFVTQIVVAVIAPIVPLAIYVLARFFTRNVAASILGASFISLFGTYVYLTSSGWKLPLGMTLVVLAVLAFVMRESNRMRWLMTVILLMLPLIHHLAAVICYMTVAYLVGWSWFYGMANGHLVRRHYLDLATMIVLAVVSIGYYAIVSFDRLAYIGSLGGLMLLLSIMAVFLLAATIVLMRQHHSKLSFAVIPAGLIFLLAYLDYHGYILDYVPSQPVHFFYLMAIVVSVLIAYVWYGLEYSIESSSSLRALPLSMLLPPVALIVFGFVSPTVPSGHQLIYRTFDMADPALGLCIAVGFAQMFRTAGLKKIRPALVAVFLVVLLVTTPFGLYTEKFTGVRHDTQGYEIDAFHWIMNGHYNGTPHLATDERLSYVASVIFNLGKDNTLPWILETNHSLTPGDYNMYLESWSLRGVSDYPDGIRKPSSEFVGMLMEVENVLYVAGPSGDRLYVIQHSWIGQIQNNWYYSSPADFTISCQ